MADRNLPTLEKFLVLAEVLECQCLVAEFLL
jgi:hypothetical protein